MPNHGPLVNFLYEIAQLQKPELITCSSPLEFKVEVAKLKEGPYSSVDNHITAAVLDRIAKPSIAAIRSEYDSAYIEHVRTEQWIPLHNTWTAGVQNLINQKFSILSGTWSNHPDSSDLGWMAFVNGFKDIQLPSLAEIYSELLSKEKLTGSFLTAEKAVLLESPTVIRTDEIGRPHAQDGYAVEFEDMGLCAWKGVLVPDHYILQSQHIRKADILKEVNVELRRALMEILGAERFSQLLDLETLDQSVDAQGNLQSLYRTRERDNLIREHLYFAHVVCPSTNRNYYLPVPPELKSAHEAVAWTFGLSGDDYKPSTET